MNRLKEILKSTFTYPNVNEKNVILMAKNALQHVDPRTYNEWKESGFNINYIFHEKYTLLHLAVTCGYERAAEALIKSGVNIEALDKDFGRTSLHLAASRGHVEIIKLLLQNGANVNALSIFQDTPLHIAVKEASGNLKIVIVLLIENGANVNAVNGFGETPLHNIFSSHSCIDAVKALIQNGAQVCAVDFSGNTPLHRAVQYGPVEVVKILVDSGADVNAASTSDRYTPLHLAVKIGIVEKVQILVDIIDNVASIDVADIDGKTPLDYARENGFKVIDEYLSRKRAILKFKQAFRL